MSFMIQKRRLYKPRVNTCPKVPTLTKSGLLLNRQRKLTRPNLFFTILKLRACPSFQIGQVKLQISFFLLWESCLEAAERKVSAQMKMKTALV